jgi:hypothetical protein
MSTRKKSYDTEISDLSSFFSFKMRHDKGMAARVYKSLQKNAGHVHREHRSKKGRNKKQKPDYAMHARQAKREKREVTRQIMRVLSTQRM